MLSRLRRALPRKRQPIVVVQNFAFPHDADATAVAERVAEALRVRGA